MTVRRVLIADDHPLFRAALRQAVTKLDKNIEIIEVSNLEQAQATLAAISDIKLVLLDLHMSDSHGFSGLIMIRQEYPALPVIVVSASEDLNVMQKAMGHGASGFIPKSTDLAVIGAAINSVFDGDVWLPEGAAEKFAIQSEQDRETARRLASLTPAQFKVLMGLIQGLLNKQIAYNMDISEATVKAHVTAIFRKLNVNTRTQAVIFAQSLEVGSEPLELS
ncbi:response regulator [Paremcibacter congregatus]|uniref:DNA-binding response regulator n=1 Tax=Paremcibacter congregatus TaxID=2043170 RepID=A0A2G4YSA7_9PROT|nr:response regulator transcription factor [Paremcibacter congregatus]PHZ85205.1 DNA-binding response regulator [Paremcibacter congregatus]QDE27861.1 response regulator transcription factor [Paremcibacter congregatus]